jgi:hypothetical protein
MVWVGRMFTKAELEIKQQAGKEMLLFGSPDSNLFTYSTEQTITMKRQKRLGYVLGGRHN